MKKLNAALAALLLSAAPAALAATPPAGVGANRAAPVTVRPVSHSHVAPRPVVVYERVDRAEMKKLEKRIEKVERKLEKEQRARRPDLRKERALRRELAELRRELRDARSPRYAYVHPARPLSSRDAARRF